MARPRKDFSEIDKRYSSFTDFKRIKDENNRHDIIAICNQKGGVGKTTTSINLAASLAYYGRKTLLVDLDPQGAATAGLGFNIDNELTIYELLMDSSLNPNDSIIRTKIPKLDLIPANIDLSAAEITLVQEVGREAALKRQLDKIKDDYDVILIDCQPTLGLLNVNALTAASKVVVPVAAEFFALKGLKHLLNSITKIKEVINPDLELSALVTTMFNPNNLAKHSEEIYSTLMDGFHDKLLKTIIYRTTRFPDASIGGKTMLEFDKNHSSTKGYLQLARELIFKGIIA